MAILYLKRRLGPALLFEALARYLDPVPDPELRPLESHKLLHQANICVLTLLLLLESSDGSNHLN